LRNIPEEVLQAIKKLISLLSEKINIDKAYLYGSYARGSWLKTSDIDLIIVSPSFENMPLMKRLDMINEVQWKAGIHPYIEAIPLTPIEFKEKSDKSTLLRDASKYWIEIDVKNLQCEHGKP